MTPVDRNVLPDFTEHFEDRKNQELHTPLTPSGQVRLFLDRYASGRPRDGVRILDVGCGRGDTVAWLRAQGWDAYGIDVDTDYLGYGRRYLTGAGDDAERLQAIGDDGRYPFEDDFFDLVFSDQVIEHVADLDGFAAEVARVSISGGRGLHIYPAKWRPVEPHLRTPCTHWLPKGRLRRAAEAGCLRAGIAAPYFTEYSFAERVEIYNRYSEEKTFYRPLREVIAVMNRHGLSGDVRRASRDRIGIRLPRVRGPGRSLLGWWCRHLHSVALYTVKKP